MMMTVVSAMGVFHQVSSCTGLPHSACMLCLTVKTGQYSKLGFCA